MPSALGCESCKDLVYISQETKGHHDHLAEGNGSRASTSRRLPTFLEKGSQLSEPTARRNCGRTPTSFHIRDPHHFILPDLLFLSVPVFLRNLEMALLQLSKPF